MTCKNIKFYLILNFTYSINNKVIIEIPNMKL